eukprot:scaffold104_cov33-Tisochrysis_lutea.AAC.1
MDPTEYFLNTRDCQLEVKESHTMYVEDAACDLIKVCAWTGCDLGILYGVVVQAQKMPSESDGRMLG